jgi:hypothetical protein
MESLQLQEDQVLLIANYLNEQGLQGALLYDELLDHLCCDIESLMAEGSSFEEAWHQLKTQVPAEQLHFIEHQTQLSHNKPFNNMKRLMLISGSIAAGGLLFGSTFKVMHWPMANVLTVLGGFTLTTLFLPSYFIYLYRKQQVQRNKLMFLFAFLGPFCGSLGVIGKTMHWPGATYVSIAGLVFLALGFIPLYLYRSLKSSEDRAGSLAMVMILLISVPVIFMVINPKPSKRLQDSIAEIARRDEQMAGIFGRKNSEGYFTLRVLASGDSSLLMASETLSSASDALVDHLEGLKKQVIADSDGGNVVLNLQNSNNFMTLAHTRTLFFDQQGAALLREKFNSYQLLVSGLNTHAGKKHQAPSYIKVILGEEKGWADRQFTDKALIDVVTYLSMLQTAIRATEAETLQRLILKVKYQDHPLAKMAGI